MKDKLIELIEYADPYICACQKSKEIYNLAIHDLDYSYVSIKKLKDFSSTLLEYNPNDMFLQCLRLKIDSIEQDKSTFRRSLVNALEVYPLSLEIFSIGIAFYAEHKYYDEVKNLVQIQNFFAQSFQEIVGTGINKRRLSDTLKTYESEDKILSNSLLGIEILASQRHNFNPVTSIQACIDIITANSACPFVYNLMLKSAISTNDKSLQRTVLNYFMSNSSNIFSRRVSCFNKLWFVSLLNITKQYHHGLKVSELLARTYPRNEVAQLCYLIMLNACKKYDMARNHLHTALITLPNSVCLLEAQNSYFLDNFNASKAKRSLDIYRDSRRYEEFNSYEYHYSQLIKAKSITYESNANNDCDVLCIASDEAPYIHEFIFHYLYLGFRNIFIGINNSTDSTLELIDLIQQVYPQVYAFDVQESMDKGRQDACYAELYTKYLSLSSSEYFLIVDIDEFWVSSLFPEKITDYIQKKGQFLCHSSNIVNIHNEKPFAQLLNSDAHFFPSAFVKSFTSRHANIINIRTHASYFSVKTNHSLITKPSGINNDIIYDHLGKGIKVASRIDHRNAIHAVFLHRLYRSEIEYVYRIFKVRPNALKATELFKTNRFGYDAITPCSAFKHTHHIDYYIKNRYEYYRAWFSNIDLNKYWKDLNNFTINCGIENIIAESRSMINQDNILSKLNEIQKISDKSSIEKLKRALTNTSYQKYINEL